MNVLVDHYATLGVEPTATPKEIRSAYRSVAQVLHPDRGGDPTMFQIATESYDLLMDPTARSTYDFERRQAQRATAASASSRAPRSSVVPDGAMPPDPRSADPADLTFRNAPLIPKYYTPITVTESSVTYFLRQRVIVGTYVAPVWLVGLCIAVVPLWPIRAFGILVMLLSPLVLVWINRAHRRTVAERAEAERLWRANRQRGGK